MDEYMDKSGKMRCSLQRIDGEERDRLVEVCQKNMWIKKHGIAFVDDPFLEMDSPYSFSRLDDLDLLVLFFEHGNWAIREGVVYHDLAFIQQVNGGDEYWTLKRSESGEWIPFESVSCGLMIEKDKNDFINMIGCMERATIDQCERLKYMDA